MPGGDHSSGPTIAGRLLRSTSRLGRAALRAPRGACASYLTLLQVGFAESDVTAADRALLPHVFTLAPRPAGQAGTQIVLCGTVPWGRPRRQLAGTSPCEARTFLWRSALTAASGHLAGRRSAADRSTGGGSSHAPGYALIVHAIAASCCGRVRQAARSKWARTTLTNRYRDPYCPAAAAAQPRALQRKNHATTAAGTLAQVPAKYQDFAWFLRRRCEASRQRRSRAHAQGGRAVTAAPACLQCLWSAN